MARFLHVQSAALAAPALLLAGCGLPEQVVRSAEHSRELIDAEAARIESQSRAYREFQESDAFVMLASYAEREKWDSFLAEARAKRVSADSIFRNEVEPLLERNSPDDAEQTLQALGKIQPLLDGAREASGKWSARRDFLARVAEEPDQVLAQCAAGLDGLQASSPKLETAAAKAKGEHPARKADIDRLAGPLLELASGAEQAVAAARAEHQKIKAGGEADLALLGDSCEQVSADWDAFRKAGPELSAKLAELDRSYSRNLIDMKVEYGLVVRRQTWDDSRDSPTLHNLDFRIGGLPEDTFLHLAGVGGALAKLSRGFFGERFRLESGVEATHWNLLGIDPKAQWPAGDTAGEFWVEDTDVHYFHKYFVVENGQTSETDWTEVTEAFFLANVDNLGMDVESKPYGAFDSEKLTHAAPPGMGYVGNPRYGRWESDGSGGMYWNWLGPYLFYSTLFGSPARYGRGDWDTWNGSYRGSRPYYGGTSAAPRWGSRSKTVQTSPRTQASTFARRGGFQRPPSSVRTAGSLSRGGSFGGSGK